MNDGGARSLCAVASNRILLRAESNCVRSIGCTHESSGQTFTLWSGAKLTNHLLFYLLSAKMLVTAADEDRRKPLLHYRLRTAMCSYQKFDENLTKICVVRQRFLSSL
jgi:hypothetical protein